MEVTGRARQVGQVRRDGQSGAEVGDRPATGTRRGAGGERRKRLLKLGRRVLAVVLMGLGAYEAWSHRQDLHTAVDRIGNPAWPWLIAAVAAETSSMVVFARLQRWLLRAGGVRVRLRDMVEITLAGNALATSIPGGAAWSAGWIWGQLRRRNVDRVLAGWVVLVAGALASYALFLLVVSGAEVAGSTGPVASLRWLGRTLLGLGVLVVAVLIALARSERLQRRWHRFHDDWVATGGRRATVAEGLAGFGRRLQVVTPSPLAWVEALGLALANWVADLVSLVFCIWAIHGSVPWQGIVVAYALTQISASLPITPGGLAVVEASLTALLTAYGMPSPTAVTVVLLYRLISFWFLVPVGWASWAYLEAAGRRHDGRARRHHPWAFHHHGRRDLDGAGGDRQGPERVLGPEVCDGCDHAIAGAVGGVRGGGSAARAAGRGSGEG